MTVKMKRSTPLHIGRLAQDLTKGLPKALDKVGELLAKQVHKNLSGTVLNVRSGLLRRSVEVEIKRTSKGMAVEIFVPLSVVPYARIHEFGGRTGRGGATRIPKRSYLTRALVQKKTSVRTIMKKFVSNLTRKV